MAKIGYLFAKGAFDRLREKMDPRKVNGGVFLGLNGIVIKSHGGTDADGFAAPSKSAMIWPEQPQ
jgi:glycerol-3-phosphate acyltransferase PlsX